MITAVVIYVNSSKKLIDTSVIDFLLGKEFLYRLLVFVGVLNYRVRRAGPPSNSFSLALGFASEKA